MSPQRLAVLAVLCGTFVLDGWVAAGLAGLGARSIEDDGARIAFDAPQATVAAEDSVDGASILARIDGAFSDLRQMPPMRIVSASTPDPATRNVEISVPAFEVPETESLLAALPDPQEMLTRVAAASVSMPDPAQKDIGASAPAAEFAEIASIGAALPDAHKEMLPPADADEMLPPATPAVRVVETPNECLVAETCIDDYLWSFYERTPKLDTNKVKERVKVTVKKRGKTRTVIRTITKYVAADFTWKDPMAAERAGISVKDYVIGGMDRGFKLTLYHALRAMDDAGLMPGITSAFRDDYRQAIATGNKAASDSSFHGGSRRGGYGHGLAADLVSVRGETRSERFASSVEMWKWIDAHEKELGIGRPYLDRDPPHVGPIDGKEFAAKRGGAKMKLAERLTKARQRVAASGNPAAVKPVTTASVRVGSL